MDKVGVPRPGGFAPTSPAGPATAVSVGAGCAVGVLVGRGGEMVAVAVGVGGAAVSVAAGVAGVAAVGNGVGVAAVCCRHPARTNPARRNSR